MKKILIAGIAFYRRWMSPAFPGSCRFYPTCSAYAMEAVNQYGALKGSARAAVRILKCHPWHPGGYDPVLPGKNNYRSRNPHSGPTCAVSTESEIWNMESEMTNLHSTEGN